MSLLTIDDRLFLLRLARHSVEAAVRGEQANLHSEIPIALHANLGAFVTLFRDRELRGCVGFLASTEPLYKAVIAAAAGAALRDPRFTPVLPAELPVLDLEISVLSEFEEIRPDEIRIGTHGLVVTHGSARGLLLPQVAVERNWSAQRFLEETCRKAGLAPDAWRRDTIIEAFTADVFSEHDGADGRQSA